MKLENNIQDNLENSIDDSKDINTTEIDDLNSAEVKNKSRFFIFGIALGVTLTAILLFVSQFEESYSSKQYQMAKTTKITTPKNVTYDKDNSSAVYKMYNLDDNYSFIEFYTEKREFEDKDNKEDILKQYKKTLKKIADENEHIESYSVTETKVNNTPAIQAIKKMNYSNYSDLINNGVPAETVHVEVFTLEGEYSRTFTLYTTKDKLEDYMPVFNEMINTVKF